MKGKSDRIAALGKLAPGNRSGLSVQRRRRAGGFGHREFAINRQILEILHMSAGPINGQSFDQRVCAETKMYERLTARHVPAAEREFTSLQSQFAFNSHDCTDAKFVRRSSHQSDFHA